MITMVGVAAADPAPQTSDPPLRASDVTPLLVLDVPRTGAIRSDSKRCVVAGQRFDSDWRYPSRPVLGYDQGIWFVGYVTIVPARAIGRAARRLDCRDVGRGDLLNRTHRWQGRGATDRRRARCAGADVDRDAEARK